MWFNLQPVELEFLESAPRRWVVEARLSASRSAVWDAFVDPATWCHWFPGVLDVSYPEGPSPPGVGTRRFSHVGGQRYEETMLAWDEGVRWAYRIDRTTLPLSSAHIECTDFEDDGSGTCLRWTLAAKPRWMLRVVDPFMEGVLHRLLARAARNLDVHLMEHGARFGERHHLS